MENDVISVFLRCPAWDKRIIASIVDFRSFNKEFLRVSEPFESTLLTHSFGGPCRGLGRHPSPPPSPSSFTSKGVTRKGPLRSLSISLP
ncbi:hypothetical protein CEXT_790301 [Caerostris extrusa]|uniref:Uncharacterized protein n=1 Tax=Caerostris extrusa TaxID=172846 RepID=A0AAV4VA93_CAEEX|nr:hypothetical protein CEXT_790301 [Caerostris extrusa]